MYKSQPLLGFKSLKKQISEEFFEGGEIWKKTAIVFESRYYKQLSSHPKCPENFNIVWMYFDRITNARGEAKKDGRAKDLSQFEFLISNFEAWCLFLLYFIHIHSHYIYIYIY